MLKAKIKGIMLSQINKRNNRIEIKQTKKRCKKLGIEYKPGCFIGENVKILMGKPNIIIEEGVRIADDVVLWGDGDIIIGKNTHIGEYNWIYSCYGYEVRFGEHVNLAAFCYIINADHGTKANIPLYEQDLNAKNIYFGNDIWVGARATILKGTHIEDGSVIGAGSVVKGIFADKNVIICGNPAKVIKERL